MTSEPPSASSLLATMRAITAKGQFGMSLADLCRATGSSRTVINRLLYRLGSEGKVFSDGRNGAQRYYLFVDARGEPGKGGRVVAIRAV